MANNNIEQYLEAMLAALDGDTVPDVPTPSWNIEKYLAAILTKLSSGGGSSGGGSGGGALVVTVTEGTMDKTWQEIHDAYIPNGAVAYYDFGGGAIGVRSVAAVYAEAGEYGVVVTDGTSASYYLATSENGYPTNPEE